MVICYFCGVSILNYKQTQDENNAEKNLNNIRISAFENVTHVEWVHKWARWQR